MKLRYAVTQNSIDGISVDVCYAFDGGDTITESFPDWDCAVRRMNDLYREHGLAEQPITLSRAWLPAPPIVPTPPRWSTTPPGEPGWYWMRNEWYDTEPFPALFDGEWWTYRGSMVRHPPCAKEYWPVRIEPPR